MLLHIAIFSPVPVFPHFVWPLSSCIQADLCNHTWVPECGLENKTKAEYRLFIDSCDLLEFNCDKDRSYEVANYSDCFSAVCVPGFVPPKTYYRMGNYKFELEGRRMIYAPTVPPKKTFNHAPAEPPRPKTTFNHAPAEPPRPKTTFNHAPAEPPRPKTTFNHAPAEPPRPKTTFNHAPAEPPRPKKTFNHAPAEPPRPKTTFNHAPAEPPRPKTTFNHAPAEPPRPKKTFNHAPAEPPRPQTTFNPLVLPARMLKGKRRYTPEVKRRLMKAKRVHKQQTTKQMVVKKTTKLAKTTEQVETFIIKEIPVVRNGKKMIKVVKGIRKATKKSDSDFIE